MLAALIRFSLTQRLLLLVLTAMLVGVGIQAFRGLPIDAFPDVSTTQVKIILKAPGMTPEEVETRIAMPAVAPGGRLPCAAARRSPTCWRAQ